MEEKLGRKRFFVFKTISLVWLVLAAAMLFVSLMSPKAQVELTPSQLAAETGELSERGWFINEGFGYSGYFASTPGLELPRGSYTVEIDYSSDTKLNLFETTLDETRESGVIYDKLCSLPAGDGVVSDELWVLRGSTKAQFKSYYVAGGFYIRGISVRQNNDLATMLFICALVAYGVFAAVFLCFTTGALANDKTARMIFLALCALTLLASVPLFIPNLKEGHDLPFHLLRIEGLAEGLRDGQLPVRMRPLELNGYGYATSVFYPELFLYIPALLRLAGFPLQTAYKLLLLLCNAACAGASYYSFKHIFRSRGAGLACACAYTLAQFRLVDLYLRSALGEALAMTFLPLVALCMIELLFAPVGSREFNRAVPCGIVGFCGLIQSHIISVELCGILVGVLCLVCFKRTFSKGRFAALARTALWSLALNLWFIVPLVSYMLQGRYKLAANTYDVQDMGAYISQLFMLFVPGAGVSVPVADGLNDMPFGIGLAFILSLAAFALLYALRRKSAPRASKLGLVSAIVSVVLLFMSTWHFPWKALASLGGAAKSLVDTVQFPWRLLTLAALFLSLVCGAAFCMLRGVKPRRAALCALGLCGVFTLVVFLGGTFNSYVYRAAGTLGINSASIGNGEYLPDGCDHNALLSVVPTANEDILNSYERKGTTFVVGLNNNSGANQSLTLPLLYYPGYAARGEDGTVFTLYSGDNCRMTLDIPAGYSDTVTVSYSPPALWTVCDLFSLAAFAVFVLKCRREQE